jgi:hypothetical protein
VESVGFVLGSRGITVAGQIVVFGFGLSNTGTMGSKAIQGVNARLCCVLMRSGCDVSVLTCAPRLNQLKNLKHDFNEM